MRKLVLALALLALIPFAFAACGGDDDDGEEAAPEATTEEPAPEPSNGEASALQISADPDGALAYEQDSLTVPGGEVTIEFTNDSMTPHDVVIENPDGDDVAETEVITADTTSTSATLEAGEYTFYCSVPGHREAGMEGPLTVE